MKYPFYRLVTLVFSAKESLYKAIHKYIGALFGFEAAEVTHIDLEKGFLELALTQTLCASAQKGMTFDCCFDLQESYPFTLLAGHL
ncbi:4'-phosphopantetheinyl transferase superfamily protein [Alteromonas sp. ASW11-130]|uniref:4'-phosphopantetheinyl transferase superfamily protein n=1 Tax=Alteromonas sp. ASW11-130 TaxID=3015775 RepID=UPI003FA46A81